MSSEVTCVDEDCIGLLTWLEYKATDNISKALTIGKSFNRGRGLYASEDLQKGDCILKVPFSLQLTLQDLPPKISSLMGVTNEAKLAVLILIEKRWREVSIWKNYMDCLPLSKDMHNSIFWSDDELKTIRLSFVYDETLKLKHKVEQQFWKILNAKPDLLGSRSSEELEVIKQQFMYSYGLVISRSRKNANGVLYLAPFLDFLNHDTSSMVVVESDANQGYIQVRVDRDYAKGDEILINYGNLPNAALVMFYGFTVPNNAHDFVLLAVNLDMHDKLYAQKSDILSKDDKPVYFKVRQVETGSKHGEGIPLRLRAFFRVRVCDSKEELKELKEAAVLGRVGSYPLKKLEKEIKAHVHLWYEVQGLVVKYNKNELLKATELCEENIRRLLAKDLLQAEVRILNSVSDWLKCYVLMLVKKWKLGCTN